MGCPIRKSTLHRIFAPKRGLSQLVTSFVASESQGILHVPFSPFLFFFRGKSPLIILVFFAVIANIPSACEVLICLVDVLFLFNRFARDYRASQVHFFWRLLLLSL